MAKETPEDIRFGARFCTSKIEYVDNPSRWKNYAESMLRRQIADRLQSMKSEVIETDDMHERRLDIYAATPDVFWRIVQREAEKIAGWFLKK